MQKHLQVIGILLITLSFVHLFFPRYMKWKQELRLLSLINKQVMMVHTFFIALAVFLIGLLCIASPNELLNTSLGKSITFGLAVFWTIRLIIQFFGYSTKLWKGKTFETTVHVVFSCFW
ncbi:hypothetical protein E1176_01110, partial [Fulvivirga sp. RKSG066]|nr:hypothetical protein [Fulvivirga aurantia]